MRIKNRIIPIAIGRGRLNSNPNNRHIIHLVYPRVDDAALAYLAYLLREVDFDGTLLVNPYFRSVGLEGSGLEERLRPLIGLRRQGELLEIGWPHPSLEAWAAEGVR